MRHLNLSERLSTSLVLLASLAMMAGVTACEEKAPANAEPVATAEPAAPAEAPAPVDPANDDRYDVVYPTDALEAGAASELALVVKPGRDYKINKEFPWKVELEAPAGAELGAATIGKEQIALADEQASIPMTLTAAKPGPVEVTGKVSFSVCNDDRCEILRDQPIAFKLEAEEAAAAPDQEGSAAEAAPAE